MGKNLNSTPLSHLGDFIDGSFHEIKKADGEMTSRSPADLDDVLLEWSFCYDHIDVACQSAKKAYPLWAKLSIDERKNYLFKLKSVFQAHEEELAELISRDTGKPLWEAKTEAKALSAKVDITVNESLKMVTDERIENALPNIDGLIRYRSRGVMVVLGPFNFPAHLPNGHIVPALLLGNTIVFKPSEQTAAVGQFYSRMFELAEFPAGVFNLVQGDGDAGRRLVVNELVDGILFTGSYDVGLKIKQETLSHYWKILALEMGGKNSTVVWEDADMEKALYESIVGAYMTSGQRCACTSRLILHDAIADEFIDRFYQLSKKVAIGHWSENPFMGPLINEGSVEKYLRFQEIAKREGAESLMRGKVLELEHRGYYVTPSIYSVKSFDPKSVYQQSEIFGPNVAIYRTSDFDQTMEIVNSSGYGLVAAIFTQSKDLYERMSFDARVGLLNWNRTTNGASSRMPFGGMGKSGNDRPSGHFAVQYCAVPVASLLDQTKFSASSVLPGIEWPE